MKTKLLLSFFLSCFFVLGYSQNQKKNVFELELTANVSLETNIGFVGIIGSTGMNYYVVDWFGVNTNIGFFQSIPMKFENCSMFKWDADLFFDIVRTKKDHRLKIALGASYYRGSAVWESAGLHHDDGRIEVLEWGQELYNGFGANLKLQYNFPIAEKWYLGINGECYYLPTFSYTGIVPALGVSVGYRF